MNKNSKKIYILKIYEIHNVTLTKKNHTMQYPMLILARNQPRKSAKDKNFAPRLNLPFLCRGKKLAIYVSLGHFPLPFYDTVFFNRDLELYDAIPKRYSLVSAKAAH